MVEISTPSGVEENLKLDVNLIGMSTEQELKDGKKVIVHKYTSHKIDTSKLLDAKLAGYVSIKAFDNNKDLLKKEENNVDRMN